MIAPLTGVETTAANAKAASKRLIIIVPL